jgi:DNA-binding GntR family transcriptional regulator
MNDEAAPIELNSSDQAYLTLRERILQGEIIPGAVLKERDLCEQLSISRTPIREALRRLCADGLAEARPRRSIIVSAFDDEELGEIFEVGIVLESFVAGLAAAKAGKDDVERLDAIVGEMEALVGRGADAATEAYVKLDHAFHDAIASTARSPRIAQILRQTVSTRVLTNIFDRYSVADFGTSVAQHRTIVRAIASGDSDWAKSAMDTHIRSGQAAQRRRRP